MTKIYNTQKEGYEFGTFRPRRPSSAKETSWLRKAPWLMKAIEVEMSRVHTLPAAYFAHLIDFRSRMCLCLCVRQCVQYACVCGHL